MTTMAQRDSRDVTAHQDAEPARPIRWYMVAVLTLLVILSYIDRTALSLLVAPIKRDLQLTDTQMSYLLGLSFALFYGVVSVPAGYLVDRFARRPLLLLAVLFWSATTFASGFAGSFLILLLCRTGVGMGEAVLAPGAYSLIGDSFSGRHQARAFTVFSLGNAVGGGLALVIVGSLLDLFGNPFFADQFVAFKPWQLVLISLGIIGVPLGLLLPTFREPARKGRPADSPSFAAAVTQFRNHWRLYLPFYVANFLIGVGLFGLVAWGPTMIGRLWGLSPGEIGKVYGSLQIVASLAGLFGTGLVLDRLARAPRYRSPLLVGGLALGLGSLALGLAPHVPSIGMMWALLALVMLVLPCAPVISAVTITHLTPGRMVGKFSAFTFLVVSAFGTAVGPTLVAFLSDSFQPAATALGLAVTLGAALPLFVASLVLVVLAGRIPAPSIEAQSAPGS